MKIATEEVNVPVSPVWQSLKGLSSRDAGGGSVSPQSPLSLYGGPCSSYGSSSAVCSNSSFNYHEFQRGSIMSSELSNAGFNPHESPITAGTPTTLGTHEAIGPTPPETHQLGGLSSSTTSTSLSNPTNPNNHDANIGVTNNIMKESHIATQMAKQDPQTFSVNHFPGLSSPLLSFEYLYRNSRYGKKHRRRIIQKNGECNIVKKNVAKRRWRFLQDMFTTLLDIQWRYTLSVFAFSFIFSWSIYAVIWYIIVYCHGDLIEEHLPNKQITNGWNPCVINIFSFASCFLFSIETQHTIGYGSRHTTEECPEAIFVMCIQSITGVILQAFMGGVIFTKLSRPKKRTHTLIFSREACICQRDGQLCLLFRVGDLRKSHIIEAHLRVQMIKERVTEEGEIIPYNQYEMDVGYDGGEDRILFIWPMTIVHKIDEDSPFYTMNAKDIALGKFEVVIMLEGVIENTGMTIQARSSYLPSEIRWGCRFKQLVTVKDETGECTVDYSLFNSMVEVNTTQCSAKELDEESKSEDEDESASGTPSTPLTPHTPNAIHSSLSSRSSSTKSVQPIKVSKDTEMLRNPSRRNSKNLGKNSKNSHIDRDQESLASSAITCEVDIHRHRLALAASTQPTMEAKDPV